MIFTCTMLAFAGRASPSSEEYNSSWRSAFVDDATGEVYEGGWHKGLRSMLGTCVYANGNMYEVRVQILYHLCVILSH